MRNSEAMKKAPLVLVSALLLSSCSFVPGAKAPPVETPQAWSAAEASGPVRIAAEWWKEFGSAELDAVMAAALEGNNDLNASLHRVEQARADMRIAGAPLLPSADGAGGFSWTKTNPAAGETGSRNGWDAGAGISYELDLFGARRAEAASASAAYAGSRFDHDALALVVMGDTAAGYFTVLALRERVDIARDNLKNARGILGIVGARVDAGAASPLELARQKAAVATREAALAALEQQQAGAENALAVLAGRPPRALEIKEAVLKDLKVPAVAPGQPSQLLRRRPDIRSAEMALYAADADIGAARAAFFPAATLGLDWSIAASPAGAPTATVLSLASALAVPLFSGGRLEGGLEKATARQLELAENYRKTVLVSFQEVEDALAAVKSSAAQEKALKTARNESRRAYDISLAQYKAGAIDFETVLASQAALFDADDSYVRARLAMLVSAIDLFKALGGGWQQ